VVTLRLAVIQTILCPSVFLAFPAELTVAFISVVGVKPVITLLKLVSWTSTLVSPSSADKSYRSMSPKVFLVRAFLGCSFSKLSNRRQPLNKCVKNGSREPCSIRSIFLVRYFHSAMKEIKVVINVCLCGSGEEIIGLRKHWRSSSSVIFLAPAR